VSTPRYVSLVRVSTAAQAERDTPEIQRSALARLAATRPGTCVEAIEELGISGNAPLDARPAIRRLRALTDAKAYDELRVYNVDRITRAESVMDRLAIFALVQTAGAVIVDAGGRVIDPCDESGLGEIDYYLQSLFASRERKRIQARTSAGRAEAARKGKWIGGPTPFAYIFSTTGWRVDEGRAAVLRRIFVEAESKSLDTIAGGLNRDGIPSPRGSRWRGSTIRYIARHPVYCGDGLAVTVNGEASTIPLPAIVDREQWTRVQAAISSRFQRPVKERGPIEALLRGIARCPCGQPLDVAGWTSRGERRAAYVCRSARKVYGPRCQPAITHKAPAVDAATWRAISAQIRNPALLREAAEAAGGAEDSATWEGQAKSCARELKKLEKHEGEVLRLRARGDLSEAACSTRLREIKGQRETLERTAQVASQAHAQRQSLGSALRGIETRVAAISARLDGADFPTQRELVLAVVPSMPGFGVTVDPDGRITIQGALSLGERHAVSAGEPPPQHTQTPRDDVRSSLRI